MLASSRIISSINMKLQDKRIRKISFEYILVNDQKLYLKDILKCQLEDQSPIMKPYNSFYEFKISNPLKYQILQKKIHHNKHKPWAHSRSISSKKKSCSLTTHVAPTFNNDLSINRSTTQDTTGRRVKTIQSTRSKIISININSLASATSSNYFLLHAIVIMTHLLEAASFF